MATGILVSEDEYLHTAYEPDCEFEDGAVIERNVGTGEHSELQAFLAAFFVRRRKTWNLSVGNEVRVQLRHGKYLIPDIYVGRGQQRLRGVLTEPPLLWIEILSPEDRLLRVNRKVRDALDFGAAYVWVIDPETLESELHSAAGRTELADGILRIPDTPIEVPLQSVFED
jgi:Uma2 family endonuclease